MGNRFLIVPGLDEERRNSRAAWLETAGVFRSTDGGNAWQKLSPAHQSKNVSVTAMGISPEYGSDQTILVSVKGGGHYLSTDAGQSFEATGENLLQANVEFNFIRFSPSFETDNIIYGASDWELWISRDKGVTWTKIQRPIRYEDRRGGNPGPVWFSGDWIREIGSQFSASTHTVADRQGAASDHRLRRP
ncbi:MAG: hypothetical protein IIB67_12895 [Proteobacteria bacterium]|nr:hypothetical protein [Pseudomonadota bacterium]